MLNSQVRSEFVIEFDLFCQTSTFAEPAGVNSLTLLFSFRH